MVIPKDWLEKKEHEKDVTSWTQKFNDARNGKEEWGIVKAQYLSSKLWKKIRSRILKRANGKCEKCGAIILDSSAFDIHHFTYDRIGGNEKDEDLIALCSSCHKKADKYREDEHDEERLENLYYAKLNGYAQRVYGEYWQAKLYDEDVEQEWLRWLYKKYCKQERENYELDYNDMVPEWFREMVWNNEIKFD